MLGTPWLAVAAALLSAEIGSAKYFEESEACSCISGRFGSHFQDAEDPEKRRDGGYSLDTLLQLTQGGAGALPGMMDATHVGRSRDVKGEYFVKSRQPGQEDLEFQIRPIYFDGLSYGDHNTTNMTCTKVFAWLSTPVNTTVTVPGAVLLHGGGTTALHWWNDKWAREGMASISVALEGQTDEFDTKTSPDAVFSTEDGHMRGGKHYRDTPCGGPQRDGQAYSDWERPIGEQWMFHAAADAVLANTLLQRQPGVNAKHVGITGVSWGGVITSTVMGFDSDRLAFAIPAYGCGHLSDSQGPYGKQMRLDGSKSYYDKLWDPMLRLENVHIPTMWISFPEEVHFLLGDQAATYNSLAPTAPVVPLLIPHLGHSHDKAWNREENYEFVRSIVNSRSKRPQVFAEQVDQYMHDRQLPNTSGKPIREFTVVFESSKPLIGATLENANGRLDMPTNHRNWITTALQHAPEKLSCDYEHTPPRCIWSATALLKGDITSWYINIETEDGLIISSKYNEIEGFAEP
jgi:dienelactone hydrolase